MTEINEYGDDDFAGPDDAAASMGGGLAPEPDDEALLQPLLSAATDPIDTPAPAAGVYYLVDNGVVVETLDANERWGRHLLDGQVVVHSSEFDALDDTDG